MNRARKRHLVLALALAPMALGAAGCDDPITEVLLVVKSDLQPFIDVDFLQITAEGNGSPPQSQFCSIQGNLGAFPVTAGFTSGGNTSRFSVTIQLTKSFNMQQIVVARSVFGIPFTPGQLRMLVVPMNSPCKCNGTNCPSPGTNPECDAIESPQTVEFDPTGLPLSSEWAGRCPGSGGTVFGGTPIRAMDGTAN